MNKYRKLALITATASVIALAPFGAHAENRDIGQQLSEARQEGAVWTAIALNRHLSVFDIDVDVESGTATLTGSVESSVERDLAEEVALGIEGIERVDNQLSIDETATGTETDRSELVRRFEDATLTATVKSKLLWNRNTAGLDIHVTSDSGVVTLSGVSESEESRELAGRLAANTDGVTRVVNRIEVSGDPGTVEKARQAASDLSDDVSDAWVTSKVKSSLMLNRNLKGLDIKVETSNGEVTLSGEVGSSVEKDLAVEIARNIRGVDGVSATALRVQG